MWPNPQFPVDLVTFTDEIRNGKLHILRSVINWFLRCFVETYVACKFRKCMQNYKI